MKWRRRRKRKRRSERKRGWRMEERMVEVASELSSASDQLNDAWPNCPSSSSDKPPSAPPHYGDASSDWIWCYYSGTPNHTPHIVLKQREERERLDMTSTSSGKRGPFILSDGATEGCGHQIRK